MLLLGQINGYFFTEQTSLHQSELKTSEAELKPSQVWSKEEKKNGKPEPKQKVEYFLGKIFISL